MAPEVKQMLSGIGYVLLQFRSEAGVAMTDWQPDPTGLTEVIDLTYTALDPTNYEVTQEVRQEFFAALIAKVSQFNQIADFNNYLAFIFAYADSLPTPNRQMAAIILKDNLGRYWNSLNSNVQQYLFENVPTMLASPEPYLRELCGSLVSVIVAQTTITGWPTLVPNLIASLDSPDPNLIMGAFATLTIVFEDHGRAICKLPGDSDFQPMNELIPRLLQFIASQQEDNIFRSLKIFNFIIPHRPAALLVHINQFLTMLFHFAENPISSRVLEAVCQTFNCLVSGRITAISPFMSSIIEYMILMTNNEDSQVALTASGFWSTIAETEICAKALENHLETVVEMLLRNMRYSEDELANIPGANEVAEMPDNPQDTLIAGNKTFFADDLEASYDTSSGSGGWTLRKSCGQALEDLSEVFSDTLLDVLIPLCGKGMYSEDWLDREACIIALGATSSIFLYCGTSHLSQIMPYLMSALSDARPLIRSIAAWTISRYSRWIVDQGDLLPNVVNAMVKLVQDRYKKPVNGALSALAILAEEAGPLMKDFVDVLLPLYMDRFQIFQDRPAILLLDALGALSEVVGDLFNSEPYISMLMPPLIQRWNELDDHDPALLALMDCIARIAQGLGLGFFDYAEGVWERCIRLCQEYLTLKAAVQMNPALDDPDSKPLTCSLELMSAIMSALGSSAADLVGNSNIIQMLYHIIQESVPHVLRAAFSLVGGIASSCFVHLAPSIEAFLPVLVANVRPRAIHVSVTLNATWAISEIATRLGTDLAPFAQQLVDRSVTLLHDHNLHETIHVNASILLGNLALNFAPIVATHLEHFVEPWCTMIEGLGEDMPEKETATLGLLSAIKENPHAILQTFNSFVAAIVSWTTPPPQVKGAIVEILQAYQLQMGVQAFSQLLDSVSSENLHRLHYEYLN